MTEYVYELRTNTPVGAFTGIGNSPVVSAADAWHGGLEQIGAQRSAESNGAATVDGHRFDLTLVEIVPDARTIADDMARVAQIDLLPWQRETLTRWIQGGGTQWARFRQGK